MSSPTLFGALILTCAACCGQTAGDSQPAGSNVMGAEYPRIHSDFAPRLFR